ncbi:MAG: AmmeMemoRadiSam system protein B [Planctomycetota bacterium]|jgi:AmmeMemoRadiSam system protein B
MSNENAIPNRPRLRPVEAIQLPGNEEDGWGMIALRDACGLSEVTLTVSAACLRLLALMDGERTIHEICRDFYAETGQPVSPDTVDKMIDHLETAYLLEGPTFDAFYRDLFDAYRNEGVRHIRDAEGLGIHDSDGRLFADMLAGVTLPDPGPAAPGSTIKGIVAPHLDYPRGAPCYAMSYGAIKDRPTPGRVIILGTNHFGRSPAVVATASDFATPLGITPCDVDFLELIETRCGDLRQYELDHAREHSIELQVAWLQHLYGAGNFSILPFLCPDPCGPTGTAPYDGKGVDLHDFASTLGELIASDPVDTLVIAGADLSHVGRNFGDERELDDEFLSQVGQRDANALRAYVNEGPAAFVNVVAQDFNPSRICSAGCMYAIAVALEDQPRRQLGYHQAVDRDTQTCVTCASVTFG